MATPTPRQVRTDTDPLDARAVLLAAAYAIGVITTVVLATATAAVVVGFTAGLGQFVVLAAGWLLVVSAAPELAKAATASLAEIEFGRRVPRTSRAVTSAVTFVLAR